MKNLLIFFRVIAVFSILGSGALQAQAELETPVLSEQLDDVEVIKEIVPESLFNKVLKVGVYEQAPFAFREEGSASYQGISIDVWEEIARKGGLSFEYIPVTQKEGVLGISEGKYDLLLGRIPDFPLKKGMKFEYTIPIYVAGLGVAFLKESTFKIVLNYISSLEFLLIVAFLLLLLFLQAVTFWIFEHKENPLYKKGFWKGIGNGLWWSTGIVNSAGVADGETKTVPGRCIAGFWMFASLLVINFLIGSIVSELTVEKLSSRVQEIEDLKLLCPILCVKETFGKNLLVERSIPHETIGSLEEGLDALRHGKAEALVYSAPLLRYALFKDPISKVKYMSVGFGLRYYSFIVPEQSGLLRFINQNILDLMNGQKINKIAEEYLGKENLHVRT